MKHLRNIVAIIIGLLLGSLVNGALLMLNGSLVALPSGVDMQTPEGIAAAMPLLPFENFAVVFAAHAMGTFIASAIATLLAKPRQKYIPYIIGGLFLIAGSYMVTIIPAPLLFCVIDLLFAYLPMAFLAYYIFKGKK